MELVQKWTDGNFTVTLDMRELERLIKQSPERSDEIVRRVAFRAEQMMKNVPPPVDTGAMKNSIYVVTNKVDNYSQAAAAAKAAAAQRGKSIETSPHPHPPRFTAYVGPCVDYAVYVEFGHHNRAPRPFVVPGLERAAPYFEELAPELFK